MGLTCNPLSCVCGAKSCPLRYAVSAIAMIAIIVVYGQRICINIVITTMVHSTRSSNLECPIINTTIFQTGEIAGGKHEWSELQQEIILGSFFLGYFAMHLPAGILSDKFGARHVLGIGVLVSTALTFVFPVLVNNIPWEVVPVLRALIGCGQAVCYPAISTLYAKWIPKDERSTIGALSFAINSVGVILGNLISGMVTGYVRNWTFAFYLWGVFGVVWLVFYYIYVYSEPQSHPRLSEKELYHIEDNVVHSTKEMKIPWLQIIKDPGVIAILIGQCAHDYTIFTLITNFPKYMNDVLNYNIKQNALVTSFPYAAQWIGSILAGKLIDYLYIKKDVNLLLLRNIATFIGITIPATFMVVAGYMNCRHAFVIVFFTLNLFTKGFFYSGLKVNHLDLTVNFAGIIMAITNGCGALTGFISPYVIAKIAPDNTLKQWHIVYWIIFVIAVVGNVCYLVFAKADRAKWDVPPDELDAWMKRQEETLELKAEEKEAKKKEKKAKKLAKKAEKEAKKVEKEAKRGA